jgi:hypothetical protein
MPELQHTIYNPTATRRVQIYRHDDRSFRFIEEKFSDEALERCWIVLSSRRSQPICDTFETALREAQGRVAWLAELLKTG